MLLIRLQTFIRSLLWHISRGLPKSSQKIINYRFQICQNCDQYDIKNKQCSVCGCNINNKRIFLNKLAWADQKCPLNKWNAINENN
jgi:ribosomal protein L32